VHRVQSPHARRSRVRPGSDNRETGSGWPGLVGAAGTIPELSAHGWQLSGGRWLSTPEGAAVMLVYEDGAGERVGLYLRPRIPRLSVAGERQDGELFAHYWLHDNIAFALVGMAEQGPVKRMTALLRGPG